MIIPAVWEIHDFPRDYWRFLPDFWLEFAERHACSVLEPRWIVGKRLIEWGDLTSGMQKHLPGKAHGGQVWGPIRTLWSRAAHRYLHTIGRELFFPYSGLGVCLRRT